jgi:heme oxygenase|tara:strand:- start:3510 stop:4055 length:546 start_codon:yes stop_codon:yes gene_type:complete
MTNLKELTWEHHKNAERQVFVKELMSGKISEERYATLLFNLHPQYNILETFAKLHDLLDVRIAPSIHADYHELWNESEGAYTPTALPVVKEYMDHIVSIGQDPEKLMAHIYVRHMGDLSGGQMISKKIPGSGTMYQFDEDVDGLKEKIRTRLDDSMADEAKIAFDFATKLFQQMQETTDVK